MQAELDRGADLTAMDDDYVFTPLHWAASHSSDAQIIELLLEHGADANGKAGGDGGFPVLVSAIGGPNSPEVVGLLLERGADGSAKDNYGQSALSHYYASMVDELESDGGSGAVANHEIARLLLEAGADLTIEADEDALPFMLSLILRFAPDAGILRRMLEKGVVDATMTFYATGGTLLHMAGYGVADAEVFKVLLQYGADLSARDWNHLTALHAALRNPDVNIAVIRLLLDQGVDVAARDDKDRTHLHYAADHPNPEVVQALLKRGADVTATAHRGDTPLHWAMDNDFDVPDPDERPNPEVVKLLLDHGADVDARNNEGTTPLISTAGLRRHEPAELLLAHGADVKAADDYGITPLHPGDIFGRPVKSIHAARTRSGR